MPIRKQLFIEVDTEEEYKQLKLGAAAYEMTKITVHGPGRKVRVIKNKDLSGEYKQAHIMAMIDKVFFSKKLQY